MSTLRITIGDLLEAKRAGRKFAAVSCYDYTTARLVAAAGTEMVLVGDSAAQVILGFDSTLPITMDVMVALTAGVRRGAPSAFLVADMPFLSYQTSLTDAVRNAGRFVQECGAQMVKIEASSAHLDAVKAVSDAGMAVMAHIGIRPQTIARYGQLKAEGTTAESAWELAELAQKMVQAGAAALLLEGTAREVARIITAESPVPVVSCGSGPDCDGQILIISDILGLTEGKLPKFSKAFADLAEPITQALAEYARQVRQGVFPDDARCYHLREGELEKLNAAMGSARPVTD